MATTIKAQNNRTVPRAYPQATYKNMSTSSTVLAIFTATVQAPLSDQLPKPFSVPAFWSERNVSQVTIAGAISISARAFNGAGWTARLRAELYKITAGGSDIETFIGSGDSTANITTTNAAYTINFTPPTPVTLAPDERLILRMYAIPDPTTGDFGSGTGTVASLPFSPGGAQADLILTLTETLTFTSNQGNLITRRTAVAAIGNFFDMLTTRGASAATSGATTATAGGTEIQATRTAGGTPLEWVSPRLLTPWMVDQTAHIQAFVSAWESATTVNASIRVKVFRRQPDGTETLIWSGDFVNELGITTTPAALAASANQSVTPTALLEDDRVVLRIYVINFGTMAAGTVNVAYDHNVNAGSGDTKLTILDFPKFKLESDPARVFTVPGGMTTGGVGN